jgi:hypothetical protein
MKKIIRMAESDLRSLVARTVKRIIREDVLGNDWRENEDVLNNYEAFDDQKTTPFNGMTNDHDWSVKGDDGDPTYYEPHEEAIGWNDDEAEGYEEDPDSYKDDYMSSGFYPSDGDLYDGRA